MPFTPTLAASHRTFSSAFRLSVLITHTLILSFSQTHFPTRHTTSPYSSDSGKLFECDIIMSTLHSLSLNPSINPHSLLTHYCQLSFHFRSMNPSIHPHSFLTNNHQLFLHSFSLNPSIHPSIHIYVLLFAVNYPFTVTKSIHPSISPSIYLFIYAHLLEHPSLHHFVLCSLRCVLGGLTLAMCVSGCVF